MYIYVIWFISDSLTLLRHKNDIGIFLLELLYIFSLILWMDTCQSAFH